LRRIYPCENAQKFQRHKTIENLLASLLEIPEKEVSEYNVGGGGEELTNKVFIKCIKHQGIWGFVDKKRTVHYWMKKGVPFENVIMFVAHETGHLNGRQFKNLGLEEAKAHQFDQIAAYAYKKAKEITVE